MRSKLEWKKNPRNSEGNENFTSVPILKINLWLLTAGLLRQCRYYLDDRFETLRLTPVRV